MPNTDVFPTENMKNIVVYKGAVISPPVRQLVEPKAPPVLLLSIEVRVVLSRSALELTGPNVVSLQLCWPFHL